MTLLEIKEIFHITKKDMLILSLKAPKDTILLIGQFLIIGDNTIQIKGMVVDLPPKTQNKFGQDYKCIDCMINNNKNLKIGDLLILSTSPIPWP
jgi:hypothetical protein